MQNHKLPDEYSIKVAFTYLEIIETSPPLALKNIDAFLFF
jgi:hypothetical protein